MTHLEKMKNYLKVIDEVIEKGPYKDDWNTMLNHKVPDWYRNAKFGIFIHWGVYSVPAYSSEWYARNMYKKDVLRRGLSAFDHHVEVYGPHKEFGYRDFVPMFKAEKFDASAWADLFQEAGAKFVMPVAEHHDGFPMYDCDFTDWWIQVSPMKPYLKKFMAYYYNRAAQWGEEVTINYKNDAFMHTTAVKDIERGQLADVSPFFWQNDTSVAKNSWCYTEGNDYKEPFEIICDLVDVVSKNGSLLLNVGPKADGTIPEKDAHILKTIGAWLKVNGDAIYDSYPWRKYGEGPTKTLEGHFTDTLRSPFTTEDFRFTFKDSTIYAFAMKWPEDGVVRIKTFGLASKAFNACIKNVEILGQEKCEYRLCSEYLSVIGEAGESNVPVCIKITTE